MAYFNKIGLLLLSEAQTKFLVCEKNNFTSDFIIPGGQVDNGENDEECLVLPLFVRPVKPVAWAEQIPDEWKKIGNTTGKLVPDYGLIKLARNYNTLFLLQIPLKIIALFMPSV